MTYHASVTPDVNRRDFLVASTGLVIGLSAALSPREAMARGTGGRIGAYINIGSDESVTVLVGSSEMGQGILTGLAQLVAEELKVPFDRMRAEHAPAAADYANPMFHFQLTGGSTTTRGWYLPLRTAAAAAREMLRQAGADALNVDLADITVKNGLVISKSSGKSLTYGSLASAAGKLPVPTDPPLTAESDFKIIGTTQDRVDLPAKVNGSAVFGIDVSLPGMVFAAVRHSPVLGGKLAALPAKPAGAIAIVHLGNAFAVVASNTWKAMRLAGQVNAKWSNPKSTTNLDSAKIKAQSKTLLASGKALVAETEGNALADLMAGPHIDATYELPYLAHACMEPLNATASVSNTTCEIWAPTQGQGSNIFTAAAASGLSPDKISIHTTFLGGGLGRKFEQDFIRQAVLVAKSVGKPVKLTWSRSEDFSNDQYRPMGLVRIRAGVDAGGNVTGFHVRSLSPSITGQRQAGFNKVDSSAVEGSVELAYDFSARHTEWVKSPAAIPVGYWRSVGHSINAFAVESAIDELALLAGIDPVTFRLHLLSKDPRGQAVLKAAADLGNWGKSLPAGHARGVAYHDSFGSKVAQVIEISMPKAGEIAIHKMAVAIDCGRIVNPGQIEAQMQGCVVHGLSSALWGEMTFTKGKADQRNFSHYRMLRLREMPAVAVSIIAGGDPIGGVGEPGVPPVAPALANAYAKLTGKRVRTLPFFPGSPGGGDDD